ncbi:MAG TPA: polyhydroxyalkanoate synthesis repressor PhaR [Rubrivivax sp.]|nr:polyhydroxyalkanoate synthesis repressor PhaR [Burkholderiales bacterium]HNU10924.1 polyhydroxyalkanoate synthesis repressor PhaR [Rubrivivax sp.]
MPTSRRKPEPAPEASASDVRVLKKYPNRRLYDTRTSSYITLADVKKMVMGAEDFEVRDAKTGEDITRSILLQIILEEESGGLPMFSKETLAQIIRFYGHAMQGMMGGFFEHNLRAFAELQQRLAAQGKGLVDPKAFTPELWAQFFGAQAPLMQGLMTPYFEQSRALFDKMQEQLQKGALFPGMPGFPPSSKNE